MQTNSFLLSEKHKFANETARGGFYCKINIFIMNYHFMYFCYYDDPPPQPRFRPKTWEHIGSVPITDIGVSVGVTVFCIYNIS